MFKLKSTDSKACTLPQNESSEEGKVRGTGKEPAIVWINKASWEARKIGFRREV